MEGSDFAAKVFITVILPLASQRPDCMNGRRPPLLNLLIRHVRGVAGLADERCEAVALLLQVLELFQGVAAHLGDVPGSMC